SIEVLYEDKDIAIINKPFDIISHPTNKIRNNTVVNFLLSRYENLPSLYGNDRAGIVHRLDKDTSGLMIIALHEDSMLKLKEMFKNREIIKKYRAIVLGKMQEKEGIIEGYITRSTKNRKLMTLSDDGKYSKTTYELKEYNNGFSYVELNLHTGRTHQIRVHLSSIGHPILGDKDYNSAKTKFNINKQLLQAYYLEFHHPISCELMKFEINQYPEFKKYYDLIFMG
ncbi:MAG: RluA family pseudouridine synthase, partial [Helcococcus sp.]|nr:RluA family pseudouridine synthase [Helcococcus sp.]